MTDGANTASNAAPAAERPPNLVVGLSIPQSQVNAAALLKAAREDEYDFVTTALPHSLEGRDDVRTLDSKWWRTSVVGVCPELRDLDVQMERLPKQVQWGLHMSLPAIILPSPPSEEGAFMEYARLVQSLCMEASQASVQLWIKVEMRDLPLHQFDLLSRFCDAPSCLGMILWAEPLQGPGPQQAAANGAAVAAGAQVASQMTLLHKAIGTQLKALCFPTKVFLTNKRGYPTLAKINQVIFTEALRRVGRTLRVVVEGPSVHEIPDGAGNGGTYCLPYLQYIHHIRSRTECIEALDTTMAQAETMYLDSLQRPLQPLADHLEFQMYETFEKDPVKYVQYRSAMLRAIDTVLHGRRKSQGGSNMMMDTTPSSSAVNNHICVFVAGAGRGPLVTCTLEAFDFVLKQYMENNPDATTSNGGGDKMDTGGSSSGSANAPTLSVFALEKNPSAIIYLQSMAASDPLWKNFKVKVVHQDVRLLTARHVQNMKADIVVSELLGSFGDNELSPECLQALMASSEVCKSTTLSVPMRYTSHIAPVSSLRLYSEAKHQAQLPAIVAMSGANGNSTTTNTVSGQSVGPLAAMETPYVVRSHSAAQTHNEMDCWSFSHDGMASTTQSAGLTRSVHLEFSPDVTHAAACGGGSVPMDVSVAQLTKANTSTIPTPITVHGFLGTFTADLFDEQHPSVRNIMGTEAVASEGGNPPTQISTAPSNFSKEMCSWFPLYFPLREPLPIPAGASIGVSIWRRTDSASGYTQPAAPAPSGSGAPTILPQHRVWYEWCAKVHRGGEILAVTPIHNPNGRSYHVSM